jgi:CheY-like chemotaxis protein
MIPPQSEDDLHRVQRLLRQERVRLMRLTKAAAAGADNGAEIESVRTHLDALRELAQAVKARAALGDHAPSFLFQRQAHSVLVVDDHNATRYSISRALRASGYRTLEASAGAQALELSEFASAVVLDVQLPDLHGFEVCRLMRNEPRTRTMPIVHVSAIHRSYADREASRSVGADDFLLCPVDFSQLTDRLDHLLTERALAA